jgi:predicted nucleic acid-binding protein
VSWSSRLAGGSLVALDTAPLIDFIEEHPVYGPRVRSFFTTELSSGRLRAVTSVLTLSEVLVQPLACGRTDLVGRYEAFLSAGPGLSLVEIDRPIARLAAEIRAESSFRLPDALQIAAGLRHGATHFLCNDRRLKRTRRLTVLCLDEIVA